MKGKKIALLFVCLNPNYWPYLKQIVTDCDNFFFTNRRTNYKVDYFVWSDMPESEVPNCTVFHTEPEVWPYPTLMRYHLFLAQEEKLKEYDYIFYLDADMRMIAPVGEEVLGEGLTMAEHPMYSLARKFIPPYEPNFESEAYIQRLGIVINDASGKWFKPLYAAGGFQGGKADVFIEAMKKMRGAIDKDMMKNYIAIWNDESHWNKYLFDYFMIEKKPLLVLSPSYIFPDSLIKEYYEGIWGTVYSPKIITLTKPFTLKKMNNDERKSLGLPPIPIAQEINPFICPTCKETVKWEGVRIDKILTCGGKGKPHEVEGQKLW